MTLKYEIDILSNLLLYAVQGGTFIKKYITNEKIKAKEVRVIGAEGEQLGVIPTEQALFLAKEKELDLLMISENSSPPVCKLVNYGQFMYQLKKKTRQAKRTVQVTKELKISPKMSDNDFTVRLNAGIKFLKKRYKVKLSMFFRGREIMHKDIGRKMVDRYIKDISEYGLAESDISESGKFIIVNISPK